MNTGPLTRRQMLVRSTCGLAALTASPALRSLSAAMKREGAEPRFRIGACDWSLGHRQDPEAFQTAREIGLDGVEVSFSQPAGEQGGEFDLREEAIRRRYEQAARKSGVAISSLAMGVLNRIPYSTDPRTEKWVADVVEVMPKLHVKKCLLAFFGDGDINGDRGKQDEVIRRLKKIAPKAEQAGVVLGVESRLNADDHIRLVDSVGSPSVQVYYDVSNMSELGYNIYKEIRQLGNRICQFHMKEKGCLLGDGNIDFRRVKEAIDEIGYSGWLNIEGATVKGKTLVECYRHNQKYLRSIFPTAS